jgi:peptide/nickel transport system ATP-binding protein
MYVSMVSPVLIDEFWSGGAGQATGRNRRDDGRTHLDHASDDAFCNTLMNSISMNYGSSGSGREPFRKDPVSASGNLLEVENLSVFFGRGPRMTQVTKNVSFSVRPGERIGIVGESGCGKTVTGLSLLGLLPKALSRTTGSILFDGTNLSGAAERQLRKVRGRHIAMIFQEP